MDYIVVNNLPSDQVGAIVYWRLDGSLSLAALRSAWASRGLHEALLPELPKAATAALRAVNDQRTPRRLVRPLETGGWAIVDEDADGTDLTYQIVAKVFVEEDALKITTLDEALASSTIDAYERSRSELSAQDVSTFVVRMLERQHATTLRDRGGVYFVPRSLVPEWNLIAGAIMEASALVGGGHALFEIPAMDSREALHSILDAITREAEGEAATIEQELDAHVSADKSLHLGKRALNTRLARLEGVKDKLSTYERLLGCQLTEVRDRLERIRANITLASVSLEDAA